MKQFFLAKAYRLRSFRYNLFATASFSFLKKRSGGLHFKRYRQLILTVYFSLFTIAAFSQTTLKGRITDSGSEPLIGATVRWKEDPSKGTQTDEDGKFLLGVSAPNGTLVFSYIGYDDYEEAFSPVKTTFSIQLALHRELDEVIVVGYGSQKKSDITGAISSIKGKELEGLPNVNLGTSLTGKATGIYVKTPSGTPGAGLLVSVRGSENPLYVVDGIPMLSESNSSLSTSYDTQGNTTGNGQGVSSIADINPDDIASIEILKDASSASIYGARAANGVVLITTKRGAAGKTSFNVNSYTGIQSVSNKIKFMSSDQFVALVEDGRAQDLKKYEEDPLYFGEGFDPSILTNPLPESWFTGVNTDWLNEVMQTAPVSSIQLSASGGSEKNHFYISNSYFTQEGIVINSDYKRFNNRMNFDQTVNDHLSFGENFSFTYSQNQRSFNDDTYTGIVTNALGCSPLMPAYNDDGTYADYTQYQAAWLSDNPVLSANEVTATSISYRALGTVWANYAFNDKWAFKTSWSADFTYVTDDQYWSPITTDASELGGKAFNGSFKQMNWLGENILTYNTSWNDVHHLTALGGFTMQKNVSNRLGVGGQGFPIGSGLQNVSSSAIITSRIADGTAWSLVSFLGRVNYDYKSRYLFSFSIRADGSSRFGPENQYGYFPAGSVGWRISDENFFPESKVFTNLKLRFSYGLTGDQEIGDFQDVSFWSPITYNGIAGLGPRNIADASLRWQSNRKLNAGVDYELWGGKLSGSFEYYREVKYDLLSEDAVPGTSGFPSTTRNAGQVLNNGWELSFNATPVRGTVTWDIGFNISYLHNEVLELTSDSLLLYAYNDLAPSHILAVGQSQGSFWGINYLGVDPETGDPMYEDLNGDGSIDDNDATIIGKALPDYYGGINTSLRWKNWGFDLNATYSIGNEVYNLIRGEYLSLGYGAEGWDAENNLYLVYSNNPEYADERWMTAGDQSDIPRASLINSNNLQNSTQNLENGSYLRLSDITLSYLIRPKNPTYINSLRLYVEMQNAFTFTKYSGFDPEVSSTGGADINTTGVDYAAYPKARTFLLGLNLSF
ncbi:MAG: TonB-dependent receptor [Chitinophagales bacterium]